ncbi:MAG: GNAT family N-acetyltransferase [Gammaproteobacteria bacterium]|nr:GNAT family N-acetyltransferase [Gammaproteobacteria bacterium]
MKKLNGKSVDVREMVLEDLAAVYALGEAVFTADKWPSLYRTWDEYEPVSLFLSDGQFCFVAERDGRLAGFALGSLIDKRNSAWSYGYLTWLAVDPGFKRGGVATRLIAAITDAFIDAGARMMIADTDADNAVAIRLFHKNGFLREERHVYLSKNLVQHPRYRGLRKKKEKDKEKEKPKVGLRGARSKKKP